jgi:uncharacterized protein (DUF1330 family)
MGDNEQESQAMTAYVVATTLVRDPAVMVEYHRLIAGVLPRYQGTVVLSKTVKEWLEGGPATKEPVREEPILEEPVLEERVAVLSFPDEALARAYINSPEYQSGKRARQGGASMIMRLIAD